MGIDRKAVVRNLEHLRSQIDNLSAELSKGDDEYSPMMSWDSFNAEFDAALLACGMEAKDACICSRLGAPGYHRCSQREYLVKAHMDGKLKCDAA